MWRGPPTIGEATVDPNAPTSQVALSPTELINSLQNAEASAGTVTAASLRQMAAASLNDPSRASRTNRAPLSELLEKQAQITIAIQFDYNSARIRPDSFQAVGLMADSRSEEHTSELQSQSNLVCRLLLEKKKSKETKEADQT